ncbi:ATP-binding protein [Maridesulfovibrio salexigens]|uniref:ATP-binding protein n=1 Tax=Maridesulfovibrio salexigens (strain ATCC 14822 / DSM 2638 / NCIMB 8403 / VKM B-1763) TaxID=526222 RepID=C6BRN6_MARSD|nr:ATP-binding protein [Maridesulfovibrio salexigens]ACS79476.1 ATP-binding protein [Maridesulfovibrio salexigens DSM 2638]
MLKNLKLTNFTAFSEAELNFSKGINFIIGRNGVGKSHLLKAGYVICQEKYQMGLEGESYTAKGWGWIFSKLMNTFKVMGFSHLGRKQNTDSNIYETKLEGTLFDFPDDFAKSEFSFDSETGSPISHYQPSQTVRVEASIYIPPKEILTIYPGLAQAIEDRELSFDHTYYDLAKALGRKPLKGKRLEEISDILLTIEKDVFNGGKFIEKNSQFYFEKESIGELEAPLVAEGLCKVGMLAHLLRNGSLVKGSTLFWDEPESNLNPQLLKLVAKAMTSLADYGIQVVVATHSLFLMRELDILSRQKDTDLRFFGLSETSDGVKVSQGDSIEDIDDIQSLEAELEQSDRYLSLEYGDE